VGIAGHPLKPLYQTSLKYITMYSVMPMFRAYRENLKHIDSQKTTSAPQYYYNVMYCIVRVTKFMMKKLMHFMKSKEVLMCLLE